MAGATVNIGSDSEFEMATSAYDKTGGLEIRSINWSGISRESIETTHMTTTAAANQFGEKTFIPGDFADAGEITVEFNYNPDKDPPIDAAAEVLTINFPQIGAEAVKASWAATGFMTSMELNVPLEDVMTATLTFKITGDVTITQAAAA